MISRGNGFKYEYGPFGEVFCSVGDMAKVNPFQFSTKYTDNETDLVYYGYRYYSPALGRWLSRDPIEEQGGLNLYGFVNNDPVNYVDVIGRQTWMPPWPGLCFPIPINIEDPTIIDTQIDAFKAWRLRKGKTYPVSRRIIEDIRDEDEYKEFLTSISLKKARELARCNKSDTYTVEDTSNSFQSHNFVVGRLHVNAVGKCKWKCKKCEYISDLNICGCRCEVICGVWISFLDKYDFVPHKDDSFFKQRRDQCYGLINYSFAGGGKPFFTTGKWKESISDTFFVPMCSK